MCPRTFCALTTSALGMSSWASRCGGLADGCGPRGCEPHGCEPRGCEPRGGCPSRSGSSAPFPSPCCCCADCRRGLQGEEVGHESSSRRRPGEPLCAGQEAGSPGGWAGGAHNFRPNVRPCLPSSPTPRPTGPAHEPPVRGLLPQRCQREGREARTRPHHLWPACSNNLRETGFSNTIPVGFS